MPTGRFTTYDASALVLMTKAYPFLYMWVPAFVTHRAAVSLDLLALLIATLKTSIGFAGLEGLLREVRQSSHWATSVVPFYFFAAHERKSIPRRGS